MAMSTPPTRLLNHSELVYRPGERELAIRVFEALGCAVSGKENTYMGVRIEPSASGFINNMFYASECTPEQEALERELSAAIAAGGPLAESFRAQQEKLRNEPQSSTHFGIRLPSEAALAEVLERVRKTGEELGGRLSVSGVFHPSDPGALAQGMIQAFVKTDIVAAGLCTLGQHFELQVHLPDLRGA
jgi:hypothetical protein